METTQIASIMDGNDVIQEFVAFSESKTHV